MKESINWTIYKELEMDPLNDENVLESKINLIETNIDEVSFFFINYEICIM